MSVNLPRAPAPVTGYPDGRAVRRPQGQSALAAAMSMPAAGALADGGVPGAPAPSRAPKPQATETIAGRTGALINEVNFPDFVAQLVHGTFDAIVDASIRQMESYSSLVSAVAKTVDQFTEENVTPNQARDWLVQRYPGDIGMTMPGAASETPMLTPRAEGLSPVWLADFGLQGEELSTELLEQRLLPQVRTRVGGDRQQLLATMVMLGMNRVAVRDGSISAKVMFRAAAKDVASVQYANNADPAAVDKWGERGSTTYNPASTMVSTLAVNAQSESSVRADLFGEVKLNFVSETLPLERLADAVKIGLVQRNSATRASVVPTAPLTDAAPAAAGGN